MKKRILFIIILISATIGACAQTEFPDLPSIVTVAGSDQYAIYRGGSGYRISVTTAQAAIYDSIAAHLVRIEAIEDTLGVFRDSIDALYGTGTIAGAKNGLTEEGDTIILGGILTGDEYTTITVPPATSVTDNTFSIEYDNGTESGFMELGFDGINPFALKGHDDTGLAGNYALITLEGALTLEVHDGSNPMSIELKPATSEMVVTDDQSSKGLVYATDYSGNYTARSLIDSGAVAAMIADMALITDTTLFFAYGAGGELPGDTVLFDTTKDKVHGHRKVYEDSLEIVRIETWLSDSDTLDYLYVYGDTIWDADDTIVAIAAKDSVTVTTSFIISTIPEGNYIWIDATATVPTRKPICFRSDLFAYIKRD